VSRRTPDETRADVVRLRAEGLTQVAIAAQVGIGQPLVSVILADAGRPGHLPSPERDRRAERILRLRAEGLTQAETAARVGLGQAQVGRILRGVDAASRAVIEQHARVRATRARASHHDVLDAWADGLGQYDISLLTGRSEGAVRQIVFRARLRGDPRAVMKDSHARSVALQAA
jgi:transcriptional regulator with XRE-family HTH domain